MTVTEDAPAPELVALEPSTAPPASAGLVAVLASGDHKVLGRLWIVAALAQLLLVLGASLYVAAMRLDLAGLANLTDSSSDWFSQIVTYRAIGGTFLVLLPLTIGLATVVVPLQVGASTIAFPRAAAAAVWGYLVGSGLVIGAYSIDGGPFGSSRNGVRLFVAALALVVVAEVLAWICIMTTVITLRAPGMTLARTPLFSWSVLIAGAVWLLTLPVLVAMLVITYVFVRYLGDDSSGIYARISWAFGPPAVYAFAIPVLGFIATVVPVFSATRHHLNRYARTAISAVGALVVGGWAIPSFVGESTPWLYKLPWVAVSFLILIPVLALVGLWAATLRKGRVTLASPLLFAAASLVMLLVGLLAGAVQAIKPIKTLVDGPGTSLYGTSWTTAVASYVLLSLAIALLGGITFWAPKLIGRSLREGAARGVAALLLVGTVLWSFPDLVSGLLGQGGDIPGPVDENVSTIEALNAVSLVGGVFLALAFLGFLSLVVRAIGGREQPGDDPWHGHTLEWATSSPPPPGNFASLPEITSEAPLYDARHRETSAP
ncbi:MAG: hypothetical protein EXQ71_10525 [Acidimicrobiia bacterium]|nr:hypothetical protein [Acidimicrobiia bacterium]